MTLTKQEKTAIRLEIGNLLDKHCRNCDFIGKTKHCRSNCSVQKELMWHSMRLEGRVPTKKTKKEVKFKTKTWKSWTDEELTFIRDNYDDMMASEIAEHLGRSINAVQNKALRMGIRKGL